MSALISATAVFAAGYQRQVQQAIVHATFASGPGSAWQLSGPPGQDLAALLPPTTSPLTQPPVAGRVAPTSWRSRIGLTIETTMMWRAGACDHLVLVAGRCPSAAGEVAVSSVDAASYRVGAGDRIRTDGAIDPKAHGLLVTGVYRLRELDDPFWFGTPPTGRSGPSSAENEALGDQLVTVSEQFRPPRFSETLDVAIDRNVLTLADLPVLGAATTDLGAEATRHQSRLVTSVPASLTRIAAERDGVVSGLALTLAQLAALAVVVLALLASVSLSDHRAELGLARLRGEQPVALRRLVLGRWAAVVAAGWLLGWVPGLILLGVLAGRLGGQHGLPLGPALAVVPLVVLLGMAAAIALPVRTVLGQPVIALLRASTSTQRSAGGRRLVVDATLVVLAVSGVLVAVQSGATSVVGLLTPSLLALGLGVVLVRALTGLAARRRTRLVDGRRRRPGSLFTAILVLRLRGLRVVVLATCLATAFAVFALQVQAVGAAVRQHQAEVVTGSAAVLTVDARPRAVVDAVAALDPGHGTAAADLTTVVITRRADAQALRGMFVEPAAFTRIAYGADQTTDTTGWSRIAAPAVDPVVLTGDTVTVTIADHGDLGRTTPSDPDTGAPAVTGTRASLQLSYLLPDGSTRTADLGAFPLAAGPARRLHGAVECNAGCRVLRVTVVPNGPLAGELRLAEFRVGRGGVATPVDLGTADRWHDVPQPNPEASLQARPATDGLVLDAVSDGGAVAVQHAWVPVVLPVLLSRDVRLGNGPSVAGPDATPLAIDVTGVARDAVPRQLSGVAVADVETVLRGGQRAGPVEALVQVWVAPSAVGRLTDVTSELAARGVEVTQVDLVGDAEAAQRTTASALTGRVAPGLAALAMIFAALGVGLSVAGQRGVLGGDLAALRLAGTRAATLRRSVLLAYLLPGVLAVLGGAVAGAVGCALVIGALPLLPDAAPAIRLDLALRPAMLLGSVVGALVVVGGAVLLSVGWLARRSTVQLLRGPR